MIGLIVARSKNNVIGKNGNIPWKIKGEQKQFRELTTGNVVIMGRKSYEEIGHPLPNRMNIVVSTIFLNTFLVYDNLKFWHILTIMQHSIKIFFIFICHLCHLLL